MAIWLLPVPIWLLVPAVVSAGAVLAGAWAQQERRHGLGLALLVAASALIVVVVSTGRDPDVAGGRLASGLALAFVALGLVPLGIYYGLGAWLGRRHVVLGATWLVLIVPLYSYAFVALIYVAELVYCTPDAYECPL